MFRRFRWAFALLTLLAIVGLAAWIYRAGAPRFPIQQTVLTNGTTLRLLSVQLGLRDTDPFLPSWKQWASGFPESWTRRVGLNIPPRIQSKGSHPLLTVWLTASKAPPTPGQPAFVSTKAVPPFAAQPLLQTRTSGDLEATLESLEVGPTPVGMKLGDPVWQQTHLEFTLRQGGHPTTHWVAHRIHQLSDATGNEGEGTGPHGWANGRAFLSFERWALPLSEPWRMQVDFRQRHGFATNELWEFRNVPIATATTALIPITNRMSGTVVWINSLEHSRPDELGHMGLRGVNLSAATGFPPDERRWRLTIAKAIDSTGLDVTSSQGVEYEDNNALLFTFNVSTNATSLDLWLAYAPARTLEFTAQPIRYTPRVKLPSGSRTSP